MHPTCPPVPVPYRLNRLGAGISVYPFNLLSYLFVFLLSIIATTVIIVQARFNPPPSSQSIRMSDQPNNALPPSLSALLRQMLCDRLDGASVIAAPHSALPMPGC